MEILVSLGATSTVEGACSFSVLRRLSRCVTTGELVELTWLEVEGREVISSSQRMELMGRGCTHCMEVPCQLRLACKADTIALICIRSMLSIEITVRVHGVSWL